MSESYDIFTIVSGKPNDFGEFIRLLLISEPDLYQELFGSNYLEVLEALFKRRGNNFSYENVIFAKNSDIVLGMLLGYSYEKFVRMIFRSSLTFLRVIGWQFFDSLPKFIKLGNSMKKIYKGSFYINNLAVYPEYRGRGIGKKLMKRAEEIAMELGCNKVCLDVSFGNEKAVLFYKSIGFHESGLGKEVRFGGKKFQFIRFEKSL